MFERRMNFMYVNPFLAGVIFTILAELIVTIVGAILHGRGEGEDDK